MAGGFEALGLGPELIRAVTSDLGYLLPTNVQDEAIPLMLGGGDVMVAAETGSGKTAAFGLPLLQIIHEDLRRAKGSNGQRQHQSHAGMCLLVLSRQSIIATSTTAPLPKLLRERERERERSLFEHSLLVDFCLSSPVCTVERTNGDTSYIISCIGHLPVLDLQPPQNTKQEHYTVIAVVASRRDVHHDSFFRNHLKAEYQIGSETLRRLPQIIA